MKKFISVMLVAAMAVTALTGCGSNSGSSSKKMRINIILAVLDRLPEQQRFTEQP